MITHQAVGCGPSVIWQRVDVREKLGRRPAIRHHNALGKRG